MFFDTSSRNVLSFMYRISLISVVQGLLQSDSYHHAIQEMSSVVIARHLSQQTRPHRRRLASPIGPSQKASPVLSVAIPHQFPGAPAFANQSRLGIPAAG
jgi:hypothetical protein